MPTQPSAEQTFGHYTLLEELGRGGQGTVWLAEDHKLKRKVALKVLGTAPGALSPDRLQRFQREAEAAARLDDPHICALLDAGDVEGVPFLAFRYLEGETLAERTARAYEHKGQDRTPTGDQVTTDPSSREGLQWLVRTFEKLAHALHVAHESGLIHRDVKPANIMILPDGEPVLLDFGLARDELAQELSLTHSGDLLGTPAYMSPEQLVAQRIPLDRRTDVYSLGATLYEALTLHKPFVATTRAELYQKILSTEPSSAVTHNRQIPRDLQIVLETAMEKDRNRRYQTAEALAEDLHRVLAFEPVHAKPIGRLLRVRRWAQRHPAAAIAVVLLGLGLVVSLMFLQQLQAVLRETRARALLHAASDELERDPQLAVLLAEASYRMVRDSDSFAVLHRALLDQREERVFSFDNDALIVEILPLSENRVVTLGRDGKARVIDLDAGQTLVMDHGGQLRLAAVSPDGVVLATASESSVCTWDLASGAPLGTWPIERVHGLAWVPDPPRLAIGSIGGVVLLDAKAGTEERLLQVKGEPQFLQVSPDGSCLAVGGEERVRIWQRGADGKYLRQDDLLGDKGGVVTHVTFSPDGESLVTAVGEILPWIEHMDAPSNRSVSLWRREPTGYVRAERLTNHRGSISAVRFFPDGSRIVTATRTGFVVLWDRDGQRLREMGTSFGNAVLDVEVASGGDRIAAAAHGFGVHVWDADGNLLYVVHSAFDVFFSGRDRLVTSGEGSVRVFRGGIPELPTLRAHTAGLYYAGFSPDPDGQTIITASMDGTARLWDLRGDDPPVVLVDEQDGHESWVTHAEYSRDGTRIATACADGRARLWRGRDGGLLDATPAAGSYASRARFSPDGGLLAMSVDDDLLGVLLWSVADDKFAKLADIPVDHVWGCAWSADGHLAVVSWKDPTIRVFTPTSSGGLANVANIETDAEAIMGLDYSPDGSSLVAAARNGVVLCDVTTGQSRVLDAAISAPHATFSPDGSRVLASGRNGTATLWDRAGNELARFEGHRSTVWTARFSPDGKRVVTASFDNTAQVWCTDGDELLLFAEQYSDPAARTEELERYASLRPEEFLLPRHR